MEVFEDLDLAQAGASTEIMEDEKARVMLLCCIADQQKKIIIIKKILPMTCLVCSKYKQYKTIVTSNGWLRI